MNVKFRVWDVKKKEFTCKEDFVIDGDGNFLFVEYDCEGAGLFDAIGIKYKGKQRYFVQYFSGIKDKNNKEIYEGDILKQEEDLPNDCIEGDETTRWVNHEVKFYNGYVSHDEDDIHDLIRNTNEDGQNSWVEIVGNIFENPELIK